MNKFDEFNILQYIFSIIPEAIENIECNKNKLKIKAKRAQKSNPLMLVKLIINNLLVFRVAFGSDGRFVESALVFEQRHCDCPLFHELLTFEIWRTES